MQKNHFIAIWKSIKEYLHRDSSRKMHNIVHLLNYLRHGMTFEQAKNSLNIPFNSLSEYNIFLFKCSEDDYLVMNDTLNDYQLLERYFLLTSQKQKTITLLMKLNTYPGVCLVISFVMACFIAVVLIPSLNNFVESTADSHTFSFWNHLIWGSILTKVIIIVVSIFVFFFMKKPHRLILSYMFFQKFTKLSLFRAIYSLDHVITLRYYLESGSSTFQMIHDLRLVRQKIFLKWHAYFVQNNLDNGLDLVSAYHHSILDSDFMYFFELGILNHQLKELMVNYQSFLEDKVIQLVRRHSVSFKVVSYFDIAFVILIMFQVISFPLEAISNL